MPSSFPKKISTTLSRILQGDAKVYDDLKSYSKTKATLASQKLKHRVADQSATLSSKLVVSQKDRLPYNVEVLIDPDFYGAQIDQDFESRSEALEHYRAEWANNLADPHPLFSTHTFLKDIKKKGFDLTGSMSPIDAYFSDSKFFFSKVSNLFDGSYYATAYPWIEQHNPMGHYLSSGFIDRHNPNLCFDSDFYLNANSSKLGKQKNAYLHFLKDGWKEGLQPHPLVNLAYMHDQIAEDKSEQALTTNPFLDFLEGNPINPSSWFDAKFYKLGLGEVFSNPKKLESLTHRELFELFLDNATPSVDPSPRFSEKAYKSRYPDIGTLNGLYHYLRHGQFEQRRLTSSMPANKNDDFFSTLDIDPEINAPHQDIAAAMIVDTPRLYDPVNKAIVDLVQRRGSFLPDIIYICRGFVKGGAEKYGAKIVNTIAQSNAETKILVLAYDTDEDTTEHWITPRDNVKIIKAGPLQIDLNLDERTTVLGRFLIWNDPKVIINNNSHAGWESLSRYGKSLSNRARLCATLFCYDFDVYGQKVGYSRDYIRPTLQYMDTYITDNSSFGPQLVKDFSLGAAALKKFQPVFQFNETDYIDFQTDTPDRKQRVLWAARMSRQKNVDLLRRLALALPNIEFLAWSVGKWDDDIAGGPVPENIVVTEERSTFADMALRDIDAFLLTSHWEGLPTTVIEATVAGLPVIAADVGGVSDLIDNTRGWLVEDNNFDGFLAGLEAALGDPDEAALRVKAAQRHAQKQHSVDTYTQRLKALDILSPKRRKLADPDAGQSRRSAPGREHIPTHAGKVRLAKTTLDATIVVNGHREGAFILPTLISSLRALNHLKANKRQGEILILLDNPDEATRVICEDFAENAELRILEADVRDLGVARNIAVRAAKGKHIAFMDGDDMMSENWVSQGVRSLESYGPDVVLHPASNYIFGNGNTYIYLHRDMDDSEFELSALIAENYWTAISMAPRSLYLNFPYEANHIKQGLAYEDWSWHCYTIAKGVTHKIVPSTSHYIRRKREGSLLAQTSSSHALPRLYHLRDYPNLHQS